VSSNNENNSYDTSVQNGGRKTKRVRHLRFNRKYASKKLRKLLNVFKLKKSRKNKRNFMQFGGGFQPSNAYTLSRTYGSYPYAVGKINVPIK
jgi:hypothetical protein